MYRQSSMVYYNIIKKLNGQNFEDYLKTGRMMVPERDRVPSV